MTWHAHKASTDFQTLRTAWDDINKQHHGGNPYFDGRFISALLRHFGTGREVLWMHRTAGAIDAALITCPTRLGVQGLFAPWQAQIAPVLTQRPELLWKLFPRLSPPSLVLDFMAQDPDFSRLFVLDEGETVRRQQHALTVNIEVSTSFDDYWAGRSKKLRSNIQRYQNRLATAGHVLRFDHYSAPNAVTSAFARYAELESAGWKAKAGTQVSLNNAQGHFYSNVLQAFAETDDAVVYELYVNDRLAASRLCVRSDELLVMLKTSYDENLSSFAVGRLLLFEVLRHEFATKRAKRIEFYTNAQSNPDQVSWSTHQRPISHVTLYRYGWVGNIHRRILARKKEPSAAASEA